MFWNWVRREYFGEEDAGDDDEFDEDEGKLGVEHFAHLNYYGERYQASLLTSSSLAKSSSQYLKTVEAMRCTFCFFSTSIICICFFIATNRSFSCFSSRLLLSASYTLLLPRSIALILSSLRLWVSEFIFSCPFVSCCKILFFSEAAVPIVCVSPFLPTRLL